MPNVDGKDYPYTDEGVKSAKKDAKSSGKSMSYHNPGPEKDDVRRAAMGMLDRLPEIMDKEKIAGISISLMFNDPHHGKKKKDMMEETDEVEETEETKEVEEEEEDDQA
tara:strand:+ start:95 stop:421 length:327 start_codon:yes stop_codon:yes gene_type:complete